MYNKVILVGNMTNDPDLKYIPSGTAVCNFGLAVNRKYTSGGEKKEEVLFIKVNVWGKSGENCSKYTSKGSKVLVEGRLQQRSWESEGKKNTVIEITADSVVFLSTPKNQNDRIPTRDVNKETPDEITDIEPF